MLLRLQKYNMELQFTPGNTIPVADALSRASLPVVTESKLYYQVHLLLSSLPVSDNKLNEIRRATAKDKVLQEVKEYVENRWPENKRALPIEVIQYFQYRDELTVMQGLIFKGERIIIPSVFCKEMKEKIHQGHLGIGKCRVRTCQVMFWPRINSELTELVSSCSACLDNQRSHEREPLIHHKIPSSSWQKVRMDLFHLKGKNYIVVVDYYSNYLEVCLLKDLHYDTVISHIKCIFARFGSPKVVISDNGLQFSSIVFKAFAKEWDFEHVTSSPEHPKSNGMAERAVKIVKKIFKKAYQQNEDPYLALLAHRSTPSTNDTKAPAEKLFGRPLRTILPDFRKSAATESKKEDYVPSKCLPQRMKKVKRIHDQGSRSLPKIPIGSTVRVRENNQWPVKARVVDAGSTPRSYLVETEMGTTTHRNRRNLLTTRKKFQKIPTDFEDKCSESTHTDMTDSPIVDKQCSSQPENVDADPPYRSRLRTSIKPPA